MGMGHSYHGVPYAIELVAQTVGAVNVIQIKRLPDGGGFLVLASFCLCVDKVASG